ncbi:MAG: cobalamin-independent methionine synthase II family protein [Chloroflexi bacterium]|nr:cobalamin-independent methionine synthase II family protein [Chloroflexota bacterium]
MQRSADRLLTTHVGSLPRPDDLRELLLARDQGLPYDAELLEGRVAQAVSDVVAAQARVGIDVVADGELGKNSFTNYIRDRLSGFEGVNPNPYPGPPEAFPDYARDTARQSPFSPATRGTPPLNVGPIGWKRRDQLDADIANLKAALSRTDVIEAFMPAVAPGQVLFTVPTTYYRSDEEYLYAVAEVLRDEYRAIVDAGLVLQVDSPDTPMMRNRQLWDVPWEDYRRHLRMRIDALNFALQGLPPEQVRFHVCWGNFEGPHQNDVPLADIVDLVLMVDAGAYSIEGANHRHAHEWEVWQQVRLPEGKILIPGVIDTVSNFVDHPRLVAQRLVRLARIVGRENVIAAPDCGFGTFAFRPPRVHPEVMWAKFAAMVEGARLASAELWPGSTR